MNDRRIGRLPRELEYAPRVLTAYPEEPTTPTASNLLFGPGQTIPVLSIVRLAANGRIDIYNQLGSVDVIADAQGYFALT